MNAIQIAQRLDVTHQSASALAKSFEALGIFKEITGFKRNRLFVFSDYLNLFMSPATEAESFSTKRASKHRPPKPGA
jgi:hypothetical protein